MSDSERSDHTYSDTRGIVLEQSVIAGLLKKIIDAETVEALKLASLKVAILRYFGDEDERFRDLPAEEYRTLLRSLELLCDIGPEVDENAGRGKKVREFLHATSPLFEVMRKASDNDDVLDEDDETPKSLVIDSRIREVEGMISLIQHHMLDWLARRLKSLRNTFDEMNNVPSSIIYQVRDEAEYDDVPELVDAPPDAADHPTRIIFSSLYPRADVIGVDMGPSFDSCDDKEKKILGQMVAEEMPSEIINQVRDVFLRNHGSEQ